MTSSDPLKNYLSYPQTHARFLYYYYMSLFMRKPDFCICENKNADQLRGNRKADQRLCFPTRTVQSLYLLNPKFQASSYLLWLYSPVCVGTGRKPERWFSHDVAHMFLILIVAEAWKIKRCRCPTRRSQCSQSFVPWRSVLPTVLIWYVTFLLCHENFCFGGF